MFTTTEGKPIEPKAFASRYSYRCLRALGIRVRGIYTTKDTFVTTALRSGVKIAWLEQQTGVAYATSSATTGSGCHERARASCVGSTTRIRRCSRLACPTVEHVCPTGNQKLLINQGNRSARRGT